MRNWALRTEDYNIMQNNAFTNQDWQWNLPKSDGKDLKECSLLAKLANNKEAPSLHCILTKVVSRSHNNLSGFAFTSTVSMPKNPSHETKKICLP